MAHKKIGLRSFTPIFV